MRSLSCVAPAAREIPSSSIVCAWHALLSKDSKYSRGCKSLIRQTYHLEVLVSRKGVKGDLRSEGSETTKVGSNEQKFDTEAIRVG